MLNFNFPDTIWLHWHAHPEVLLGTIIIQSAYLLGVGPIREKYKLSEYHEYEDGVVDQPILNADTLIEDEE